MRGDMFEHGTSVPLGVRGNDGTVYMLTLSDSSPSTTYAWGEGTSAMSVADVRAVQWTAQGQPDQRSAQGQRATQPLASGQAGL